MTIRVYLVEDHPVMRESMIDFLALEGDMEICGVAATAAQALEDLADANPSILLLDLSLPDRSGLDLLEEMRESWRFPCVVLSGHGEGAHVKRALAAGADGYILKGRPDEVPGAIRDVVSGRRYFSDGLVSGPKAELAGLNGT